MTKNSRFVFLALLIFCPYSFAQENETLDKKPKKIEASIKVPYERPIGFTINAMSIASMTFEGRFLLGLFPNFSLVVSPNYQNTPEIPFYHPKEEYWTLFDIKRLNLGVGIRSHFYEFDSLDGLYIEVMGRAGMTWAGADPLMWSVIPSLLFGYSTVYKSGYSVSFGIGFEWEFLLGEAKGDHSKFLKTAYYGISKVPLTGELSIGWTW